MVEKMKIVKRNGQEVDYDGSKIVQAVAKAMEEVKGGIDKKICYAIEEEVKNTLIAGNYPLTVEGIQDSVENTIMSIPYYQDVAKAYILYRDERNKKRESEKEKINSKYQFLDYDFLKSYIRKDDPFPSELGSLVYYRTYSRPVPTEGRRERWWETVARVVEFSASLEVKARWQHSAMKPNDMEEIKNIAKEMYEAMYNLKLFPSGRSLWIGGSPSSYNYSISNFNCSFVTIDDVIKFSEIFFVLLLGTGVGLSVEKKYIKDIAPINTKIKLIHEDYTPVPKEERLEYTELTQFNSNTLKLTVGDSKFGWSESIRMFFDIITSKQFDKDINTIIINYDNIRPEGEPLKTFGGFASGHTNLKNMFQKIDKVIKNRYSQTKSKWSNLKSIDVLDIATSIAENVVSGGVRRSSLIILCDPDDREIMEAKAGLYTEVNGEWIADKELTHRMLSNNTVIREEKPSYKELDEQFKLIRHSAEPSFANMAEMKRRREDAQGGNPSNTFKFI